MAELWEITKLIRSKNASPWELTIDLMFDDQGNYERAASSFLAERTTYARIYRVDESQIQVFLHPAALALKVSMPRPSPAGGLDETDVFGGQFHSPLVHLDIDNPALAAEEV